MLNKRTILAVTILAAASLEVEAQTEEQIKNIGTTTLTVGTEYYLYDVTNNFFMNVDGYPKPANEVSVFVKWIPATLGTTDGTTAYTFHSSKDASGYVKHGVYKQQMVWWNGAANDAVSQWYLTTSTNGVKIEVGQTESGANCNAGTRSDSFHPYLYKKDWYDFTTDADAACEFLFVPVTEFEKLLTHYTIDGATNESITPGSYASVTVERQLSATNFNTVSLPFALTAEEMTTVFGSNYKAYWMYDCEVNNGNYTLKFGDATTLTANFPIIVKLGENPGWSGTSYNFGTKAVYAGAATGAGTKNGITFTGVYSKTVLGENDYFISNNKIYRAANSGSYVLPTRAYFKNDNTASVKSMVMNLDGELVETSIEALNSGEIELGGQVYTLSGMRVSGQLRPGIYVRNGKKFVVR